jgi:ribosomal protein S12 methylthiotransferase accessory factor
MYRIGETRSVPSGGALYPLTIYLILAIGTEEYEPGIYRHNHYTLELEFVSPLQVFERIERAFDTRELLDGAVGAIVITGNLARQPHKYANRGYRYTLLEAGHVAQNAYLFCATTALADIGVVEYGGFNDTEVAAILGLEKPTDAPIITLILGCIGDEKLLVDSSTAEQSRVLQEALVGDGKPLVEVTIGSQSGPGISMSQWTAMAIHRHPARMEEPNPKEAGYATGTLVTDAVIKALAEGYERYVLLNPKADVFTTARDVGLFADPSSFARYSPGHPAYKRYGLKPFGLDQERAWVYGYTVEGRRIAVPADLVYYAKHPQQKHWCYIPNSTGVAAHTNFESARVSALLELIERDAIAVTWYAKRTPTRVPSWQLPKVVAMKKHEWEAAGWEVDILNITLDLTPVCLIMLRKADHYPALATGAASSFDMGKAIEKAFTEAEYMALSWQKRYRRKMQPERVKSPDDHGLLYATTQYHGEIEHLIRAEEKEVITVPISLEEIIHRLEPITVRLDDGRYPFCVVRVMTPHLLPLTFGYESEHYGHPRVDMVRYSWSRSLGSIPHIFS